MKHIAAAFFLYGLALKILILAIAIVHDRSPRNSVIILQEENIVRSKGEEDGNTIDGSGR